MNLVSGVRYKSSNRIRFKMKHEIVGSRLAKKDTRANKITEMF